MGVKVYQNNEWVEFSAGGGTGSSGIIVQDEGTTLTNLAGTLNFTGDAVTASGTGSVKTINVSGGSFIGLTDTPQNYTNAANKFVRVNSTGTALEFLTQTPTTGAAGNNKQVQYNDGSTLQGADGLEFIKSGSLETFGLILKPFSTDGSNYGGGMIRAQTKDNPATGFPWNRASLSADGAIELFRTRVVDPTGGPHLDFKSQMGDGDPTPSNDEEDMDARIQMDYALESGSINPNSADYSAITFQTGGKGYHSGTNANGNVVERLRIGKAGEIGILAGPYLANSTPNTRTDDEKYGQSGYVLTSNGKGNSVSWTSKGTPSGSSFTTPLVVSIPATQPANTVGATVNIADFRSNTGANKSKLLIYNARKIANIGWENTTMNIQRQIDDAGANFGYIQFGRGNGLGGTQGGTIHFGTGDGATPASNTVERVEIDPNGYLIAKADIRLRRTASNNGGIYFGDSNSNFIFGEDSVETLTFNSGGTGNFIQDEQITATNGATAYVKSWNSSTYVLTIYNRTDTFVDGNTVSGASASWVIASSGFSSNNSDVLTFATAGAEKLRITKDGALGLSGLNYGTAGQVLTSGGPNAAPTWGDGGSGSGGSGSVTTSIKTFTTSGNHTYTPTSGTTSIIVHVIGGGGGSGSAKHYGFSGGAGGGGVGIRHYNSTEIGTSATITVGAGGAGGASGNSPPNGGDGSDGQSTSFAPNGSGVTLTATGGVHSDGAGHLARTAGGAGGVANSNAEIYLNGEAGYKTNSGSNNQSIDGHYDSGRALIFAKAGYGGYGTYGLGGRGTIAGSSTNIWTGGEAGSTGAVIIYEFAGGGSGSGGSGSGNSFVLLSEQTATGNEVEFTGIPSDAMEITVMLNGVSHDGGQFSAQHFVVQLGTSSGYINSGYVSNSNTITSAQSPHTGHASEAFTNGFGILVGTGVAVLYGSMIINKASSNSYTEIGNFRTSVASGADTRGSLSSVSGTIDRLKIKVTSSQNFDAGTISVSYKTPGDSVTTGTTKVAVVKDQKNYNVNGGDFFQNAWRDRDLTFKEDPFNFVTLYPTTNGQTNPSPGNSPGYFALESGTYRIKFRAPAYKVNQHMAAMVWSSIESNINKTYATTDPRDGEYHGTSEFSSDNDGRVVSDSEGTFVAEITQKSYFKVIHYGSDTQQNNNGFGVAANIGSPDPETYTVVEIEDLATAVKDSSGSGSVSKIEQDNTSAEVVDTGTGTDAHFKVLTDNTERLRIDKDGKMGLGTNNPGFQLDVDYTRSTEEGIRILNRATHTSATSMLRFGNDSNTNAAFLQLNSSVYNSVGGANNLVLGHGLSHDIVFSTAGTEKLRITSGGYVNIGGSYTQTTYQLNVTGSFYAGSIFSPSKSFVIDHPTKENHTLRHGCLEGPEHAVYVRGKTSGSVINLPDYWVGLVHDDSITVNLTPIGNKRVWVESINNNSVTIGSDDSTEYFYTIFAERKDIDKLVVEVEK